MVARWARYAVVCLALLGMLFELGLGSMRRRSIMFAPTSSYPSFQVPQSECEIVCSHGGPAEPSATEGKVLPMFSLSSRAALLVYRWNGEGRVRCAVPKGAVLQLPAGSSFLSVSLVRALNSSDVALVVPDGSLIRIPRYSSGDEPVGDEDRCHMKAGVPIDADIKDSVSNLVSHPHSRCILPFGTLLSSVGWLSSTRPTGLKEHMTAAIPFIDKRGIALCENSLIPSAPLHQERFQTTVARLGAPSLQAEWLLTSHATSLNEARARKSNVSLLLRLPASISIRQMRNAIQYLTSEMTVASKERNYQQRRKGNTKGDGGDRADDDISIDVVLLGPRLFCLESTDLREFVMRHKAVVHLTLVSSNVAIYSSFPYVPSATTPLQSSERESAQSNPQAFSPLALGAWSLISRAPFRLLASPFDQLLHGSVRRRLDALLELPRSCDALFTHPYASEENAENSAGSPQEW